MCFSAAASFTAGTALSAVGAVTISKIKRKEDILFATIPLLFGIQQLTEGVIWLSSQSSVLHTVMTYMYSVFSHVLWPTFIPLSILLMENIARRRKILSAFVVIGAMVSLYLLYFLITEPIQVEIVENSIAYNSPHFYVVPILLSYFAATCVSCLFSSHRFMNICGILGFISAFVAYQFWAATFISVWCFFAAVMSLTIYLHLRSRAHTLASSLAAS
jgi:hypothetical protein